MIHVVHFLTFTETEITRRWRQKGNAWIEASGFCHPVTSKQSGKVYIFSDARWPLYVGKTYSSVGNRIGAAFRCTPDKRTNGFAGYRFKREMNNAFLHVFMGTEANPHVS